MTDDIVGELREWTRFPHLWTEALDDISKAADEIERLRAKVERLESRGINDMQHEIAEQAAEIERLRAKVKRLESPPEGPPLTVDRVCQ